MSLLYRLIFDLTCPSLQDYPLPVAVFDCADGNPGFCSDIPANNQDFFVARIAGFPSDLPGSRDLYPSSLSAIFSSLLSGSLQIRSIADS